MSEKFSLEIISPDTTIFKAEATEVTIPSFEGAMGILKNHIPLVTFLRPGLVLFKNDKTEEKFFIEDGTVEFSNNLLLILSSTVKNLKNISKEESKMMLDKAEEKIKKDKIQDKEKYILSYKIETLREIRQ